jgi:stearoyl-CoA desaturase (Delta-9 desaturase)
VPIDIAIRAIEPKAGVATHRPILAAPRAKLPQRVHAGTLLIVPAIGTFAAVFLAVRHGLSEVDLLLCVSFYFVTIIGITVGFHRLLAHRAFQASRATKALLIVLGAMAAQGPPIYWVSNHRRHHQYSDRSGDPHSPRRDGAQTLTGLRGLWHAHVAWTFNHELSNPLAFSKDLLRDPVVGAINRLYYFWVLLGLLLPALLDGLYTESWLGAVTGLLWGGLVRLFMSYHATNSINSVTHAFGRRPFNTRDDSRNNIWLALPTGGEAWHNNHHAFPSAAVFSLTWWQIDIGGLLVWALEKVGLVWDVKRVTASSLANRTRRGG